VSSAISHTSISPSHGLLVIVAYASASAVVELAFFLVS